MQELDSEWFDADVDVGSEQDNAIKVIFRRGFV